MPKAFQIYNDIRLPFVTNVANESKMVGLLYDFNAPGYYGGASDPASGESKASLDTLKTTLEQKWSWHGAPEGGPDDDWAAAEALLQA